MLSINITKQHNDSENKAEQTKVKERVFQNKNEARQEEEEVVAERDEEQGLTRPVVFN